MRRIITTITLTSIAINLVVANAFAASNAGHTPSVSDLKYSFFNFSLFCILMYLVSHKAIKKQLQARRECYRNEIEAGARALEKAQAQMSEAQKKVSNLDGEIKELEERVRAEAKQEAAIILTEAKDQSERILDLGKETALAEKQSSQAALHQEVVELAIQKATDSLKASSNASNDKAIRENALKSVAAIGSN